MFLFFSVAIVGLSVNIEIGVEKIKLFGIQIFNGMTWSPDEPLFKLPIEFETKDIGCESKDIIDSITLYEYDYDDHIYEDSPFVFVATWDSEWQDRVTIDQANAYCALKYDSTLATIDSSTRFRQARDLYKDYVDRWDGSTTGVCNVYDIFFVLFCLVYIFLVFFFVCVNNY